jgi:Zn-dependent M28 family amino/carboxypeptidase
MVRMLKKGVPVRVAFELNATFFDEDPMQYNVLAEIPGADPQLGSEVVMLGAHFDSWHSGTGATDNGCGSAVMMEAVRLLQQLIAETGKRPRRTIRIALWSGEEQGLRGSRAYCTEHFGTRAEPKPEHEKLSGYFNLDNGTGRIRGVWLQGNEACGPIFGRWLEPFHDLDAKTVTIRDTGGTDHQAFDGVGLPGFQFIQDTISYSPRTHHSNMDNWDHAVAKDLEQAATIVASFVWHAAQRDEKLPRKPAPEPRPADAAGRRDGDRER